MCDVIITKPVSSVPYQQILFHAFMVRNFTIHTVIVQLQQRDQLQVS